MRTGMHVNDCRFIHMGAPEDELVSAITVHPDYLNQLSIETRVALYATPGFSGVEIRTSKAIPADRMVLTGTFGSVWIIEIEQE